MESHMQAQLSEERKLFYRGEGETGSLKYSGFPLAELLPGKEKIFSPPLLLEGVNYSSVTSCWIPVGICIDLSGKYVRAPPSGFLTILIEVSIYQFLYIKFYF